MFTDHTRRNKRKKKCPWSSHIVQSFTHVYLHAQIAVHTHLTNHGYFDHGKTQIPPIWAPCRDKDGVGSGISGLYLGSPVYICDYITNEVMCSVTVATLKAFWCAFIKKPIEQLHISHNTPWLEGNIRALLLFFRLHSCTLSWSTHILAYIQDALWDMHKWSITEWKIVVMLKRTKKLHSDWLPKFICCHL